MKKYTILTIIALSGISFFSFQQKPKFDLKASITRGQEIYTTQCMSCHQEKGEGIEDVYPPLAKSDYLLADKSRSIKQVLHGASGVMEVNKKMYNAEMPALELSNQEVSDVLNFVRNSWGNKSAAVKPEEVKALRKK
jgi:mono/diheme cytochrome c family protein